MGEKDRKRALKAWETMRKRGYVKKENKKSLCSYNRPVKNKIRDEIVNIISKRINKNSNIMTLETQDFLFSKSMRNQNIFVAEKDEKRYFEMIKNKPENVFLHYGDVSELSKITYDMDVIYLDFCRGFEREKGKILSLINKIDNAKIIGFTFCTRRNKKELEDYKFDIIGKLQNVLGNHMGVIFGKAYRDEKNPPMITIFFENKTVKDRDKEKYDFLRENEEKTGVFEKELIEDFIERLHKKEPRILSPSQIFQRNAKTHIFHNDRCEKLVNDIFWDAVLDKKLKFYPIYRKDKDLREFPEKQLRDGYQFCVRIESWMGDGLFDFYKWLMFRGIWRLWDVNIEKFELNSYWDLERDFVYGGFGIKRDIHNFLPKFNEKIRKCDLCKNEKAIIIAKEGKYCKKCGADKINNNELTPLESKTKNEKVKTKFVSREYIEKLVNKEIDDLWRKKAIDCLKEVRNKCKYYHSRGKQIKDVMEYIDETKNKLKKEEENE